MAGKDEDKDSSADGDDDTAVDAEPEPRPFPKVGDIVRYKGKWEEDVNFGEVSKVARSLVRSYIFSHHLVSCAELFHTDSCRPLLTKLQVCMHCRYSLTWRTSRSFCRVLPFHCVQ